MHSVRSHARVSVQRPSRGERQIAGRLFYCLTGNANLATIVLYYAIEENLKGLVP
jgi:hypothetical protein